MPIPFYEVTFEVTFRKKWGRPTLFVYFEEIYTI